jgi:hypothetical protein
MWSALGRWFVLCSPLLDFALIGLSRSLLDAVVQAVDVEVDVMQADSRIHT